MRCRMLNVLMACVLSATPLVSQQRDDVLGKIFWDGYWGERTTLFRYGNWYGPGWWGGSEDSSRVGMLPPIDALDMVAQRHDFGYQIAEELGKGRPELVHYYMAMADGIAVRDAMALPSDPALWSPKPANVEQARVYRDRIAVGFRDFWQNWNTLLSWKPTTALDPTDPDELNMIVDGLLTPKQFEARARLLVRDWNRKYAQWQVAKTAKATAGDKQFRGTAPATADGGWVLEKTELVVEKVDDDFMRKIQPAESGGDGSGSAQGTFGHPDPKVNTVRVRMNMAWTSPPNVLYPGEDVHFKITVSDAGTDDPKGLGVGGVGSLTANCPAIGDVWNGPSANYSLKVGEHSKEASKTYTAPTATPGTVLYIVADYGVFIRRTQYIYTYTFRANARNAPVIARVSTASPGLTPATPTVTRPGTTPASPPATPAAPRSAVSPVIPPVTPPRPPGNSAAVGTWNVILNGWPGTMEIVDLGGAYQGRFSLRGAAWETMLDLKIQGTDISFGRTQGDQRYVGLIASNAMRGTFSQGGAGSYVWTAEKTGGPPKE